MKIQQLSVFLENKPGQLTVPCKALAAEGINVFTLSLADTEQYGILRLVVQDWQKAKAVLEAAGCVVNVVEVVAVEVADRPGGLLELLEILEAAQINLEYMYAFTVRRTDRAVLVFRFGDPDAALEALQQAGVNVVGEVELYGT